MPPTHVRGVARCQWVPAKQHCAASGFSFSAASARLVGAPSLLPLAAGSRHTQPGPGLCSLACRLPVSWVTVGEKPLVLSTVSPVLILAPIICTRMSQPFHRPPIVLACQSRWRGASVRLARGRCFAAALSRRLPPSSPCTVCDHRGPRFSFVAPVFRCCICACILSPQMRFIVVTRAARGGATPRWCPRLVCAAFELAAFVFRHARETK